MLLHFFFKLKKDFGVLLDFSAGYKEMMEVKLLVVGGNYDKFLFADKPCRLNFGQ